jgi:ABC-type uncharacterized transport system permease subunit
MHQRSRIWNWTFYVFQGVKYSGTKIQGRNVMQRFPYINSIIVNILVQKNQMTFLGSQSINSSLKREFIKISGMVY